MSDALIVGTCRTPIGTSFRGSLVDVSAFDLALHVVGGVVDQVGADPLAYDEVALGESLYGGGNIARHAALNGGLVNAGGFAINRWCASGLAAVTTAAAGIRAGMNDLVVAGGVHSTSTQPVLRRRLLGTVDQWADPWLTETHIDSPEAPNEDMPVAIGWNTAKAMAITREEMDAWAFRSHQRAIASIDSGAFKEEIAPIGYIDREGNRRTFADDEHPRRETSLEKLASLKPLHPEIEGFSITAGNSSGINDGAAAVALASEAAATEQGLTPLAVVRGWSAIGVEPAQTGLAPAQAILKALATAGMSLGEVSLFEINEAFASVPIAACRVLDLDPQIVNVNGSGCSLGHPVATTGARMIVTMIHELRRRGGGIGLVAMCAGGGMAGAAVIEVLRP